MKIGEVTRRTGVPVRTIRFYEEVGVLPPPRRAPSGYREYDDDVIDRLRFIRSAQAVGLTLAQVREIVALRDRDELPCETAIALITGRRDEVAERIRELNRLLEELDHLVERSASLNPRDCDASGVCHIIPLR